MAHHLGFRSVAAWLTALAESGVDDFDHALVAAVRRRDALTALPEEDAHERPLAVTVRRAYTCEGERLYTLALAIPELQRSAHRSFHDHDTFAHRLFHVGESVTLVAERRSRILGFLHATIEGRTATIVWLAVHPEYRRRGVGTALHHTLREHLPSGVVSVGTYALLDHPILPFLERHKYVPGKPYLWMDRLT